MTAVRERWERVQTSGMLHPTIFALYFVAFLWAQNPSEGVGGSQVLKVAAIAVAVTLAVYSVLRHFLGDPLRAGLCTTTVVVGVLSFGHLANVTNAQPGGVEEGGLLLAVALLICAGVIVSAKAHQQVAAVTRLLNLISVFLLALNAVPAARAVNLGVPAASAREDLSIQPLRWQGGGGSPRDIYYLVFDRYAGDQTLRDLYGFDNGSALSFLESRGFTVVRGAVANYPQTAHSLASTLNMVYLDDLAERVGRDSDSWEPLVGSLRASAIADAMQGAGYEYYLVGSWWEPTAEDPSADQSYVYGRSDSFGETFYRTTAIPYLLEWLSPAAPYDPFRTQYDRVGFQVGALKEISLDPAPTFTFAHFTLPHYPYVFDEEGNYVRPDRVPHVEEAYIAQLRYTNDLIRNIVGSLAPGPEEEDPIIIIQSDEGPHPVDRDFPDADLRWAYESEVELGRKLRILHAYYFPGVGDGAVLPTLTPVNTFRALLDSYFGADLPLLPDRVFIWEDRQHPYRFTDVSERFLGGPASG